MERETRKIYDLNDLVFCTNLSDTNNEGLQLGDFYMVLGCDSINGELVYCVVDMKGNRHYSIDRFEKVAGVKIKPKKKVEKSCPENDFNDVAIYNVNHPKHYTSCKYEVIDIIEEFTKDLKGLEAVCVGNILKYVLRYQFKNGLEDLKKAQWYLSKLIETLEKEKK